MIIGVPSESYPGERRVALVPLVVPTLTKAGFEVLIETNAGQHAGYLDSAYVEKSAKIAPDRATVFAQSDIIIQLLSFGSNDLTGDKDLPLIRKGQIIIGFLRPFGTKEVVQAVADRGATSPPRNAARGRLSLRGARRATGNRQPSWRVVDEIASSMCSSQ